jgi:hypothetical protein
MDDDKKNPHGPDDSFEEHELDINTPEDMKAAEDVTFADTATESMAIFDELDDSDAFADFESVSSPQSAHTFEPAPTSAHEEETLFTEDDFHVDTEVQSSTPYNPAEDDFFAHPDFQAAQSKSEAAMSDREAFDFSAPAISSHEAFEDVNMDFPENEGSSQLGDSQLFDYDPGTTSEENFEQADQIYGDASAAGGASAGGGPGNKDTFVHRLMNNRRALRMILMFVLIGVVYGVLRVFMGGESTTTLALSSPAEVKTPAPVQQPAPEVAVAPEVAAAPEVAPAPEAAPAAPAVVATAPEAIPATPPAIAPAQTPAQPGTVAQGPQTQNAMTVPTPQTSYSVGMPQPGQGTPPGQADQIANKLNSLEASITAIDDRLATISSGGTPKPAPTNAFGQPRSAESEDILRDALHKIEGIDRKMSHLSELQTQIHILNKEVNALKSDVVQQTMIVGQSQSQMNQKMMSNLDTHAPKMIVQAAIPGRAWLRSENGQLITVIPGDEVAGYGRVVSIDPTTGTVTMSTRVVFREL